MSTATTTNEAVATLALLEKDELREAVAGTEFERLLAKEMKTVSFVPFGEKDEIELSIAQVRNFLAVKTTSGQLPSDQDIVKFLMLCKARNLNPWVGDCFLIGYDEKQQGKIVGANFSLITAAQALLKRAEANQHFDGLESGVILQDADDPKNIIERAGDFYLPGENLVGGWARCVRDDRKIPFYERLNLSVYKGYSRWNKDPGGMICKCAEASVLRQAFPTVIGGLYVQEEMREYSHNVAINGPGAEATATESGYDEKPPATITGEDLIGSRAKASHGPESEPEDRRRKIPGAKFNEDERKAINESLPPAEPIDQREEVERHADKEAIESGEPLPVDPPADRAKQRVNEMFPEPAPREADPQAVDPPSPIDAYQIRANAAKHLKELGELQSEASVDDDLSGPEFRKVSGIIELAERRVREAKNIGGGDA